MAKPAFRLPDLSNATPMYLADEMGKISKRMSFLKKMKGIYREAFLAKIQPSHYATGVSGEQFEAAITVTTPARIDLEKVKQLLTPEQLASCYTAKEQTTIRFKLNNGNDEFIVAGEEDAEGLNWDEI